MRGGISPFGPWVFARHLQLSNKNSDMFDGDSIIVDWEVANEVAEVVNEVEMGATVEQVVLVSNDVETDSIVFEDFKAASVAGYLATLRALTRWAIGDEFIILAV